MVRTQIQVHSEQMKWLKKHALEKGISMAQAIRDSVDFYRYHVETIRTVQSKKKKALRVIGSFSTGTVKSN
ncbi:MAG: CopG family transcriptional regulator [Deltaproteobacteria bacterium]|nr:CopG family transcriptional regulator [Deltaproteobacteria bacterium]